MSPTLRRYLLFQLPEWALVGLLLLGIHRYTDAPVWLLVACAVGFVAKDVVLYPWLRRAYEASGNDPGENLVGRRGIATSPVAAEGWVRVDAELWRAEASGGEIAKGAPVRVRALHGHVLVVAPEAEAPELA